jgi:hypothetical protein
VRRSKSHECGLVDGPAGCHTLRFDEVNADDIARLMRGVGYRQAVQLTDYLRNILGTWQAGELRHAAAELRRLSWQRLVEEANMHRFRRARQAKAGHVSWAPLGFEASGHVVGGDGRFVELESEARPVSQNHGAIPD